jgi:hydrogenase-4 component F
VSVVALVGVTSLLISDAMLATKQQSFFEVKHARRRYYLLAYGFVAAMLALATTTNLAAAWLLAEVSTGISGMLVAFSGRPAALEAAWKYVVLTTLGLAVSLFGITILYGNAGASGGIHALDFDRLSTVVSGMPTETAALAFGLVIVGLAAKVGWAPVHNWLPDAHGEAPPPVSAMLSAALLPTVACICWQVIHGLPEPIANPLQLIVTGFGLTSLAVAAAFLSLPMPFKRMLAYSSLEHMGVIAIGIALDTPLAAFAVLVHIAGHAIAKAVAFNATIPLLALDRSSLHRPLANVSKQHRPAAWLIVGSLGALAALPPSPLFISELLIVFAAIETGQVWLAATTALLLALGFVGLSRTTIRIVAATPVSDVAQHVEPAVAS